MQRLKLALSCVLLAALTGVAVEAALLLHAATGAATALPQAISTELQATRAALVSEVDVTRALLVGQIQATRKDLLAEVDSQATALRGGAFTELGETRALVDRRLGDTLSRVDAALGIVDAVRAELQPTLVNVNQITAHANEASAILLRRDALPAQILGVLGGAKVTLGQTAETMRDIQRATPAMLETIQKVGNNSDAATAKTVQAAEESRRLLFNLAENTTPLPKWLRYPLQVVGLVGTAAVPVITIEKLAGK